MTLKDQIIWWNARNGGGQRLIGQPDRPIDKENTRKAEEFQLQNSTSNSTPTITVNMLAAT